MLSFYTPVLLSTDDYQVVTSSFQNVDDTELSNPDHTGYKYFSHWRHEPNTNGWKKYFDAEYIEKHNVVIITSETYFNILVVWNYTTVYYSIPVVRNYSQSFILNVFIADIFLDCFWQKNVSVVRFLYYLSQSQ